MIGKKVIFSLTLPSVPISFTDAEFSICDLFLKKKKQSWSDCFSDLAHLYIQIPFILKNKFTGSRISNQFLKKSKAQGIFSQKKGCSVTLCDMFIIYQIRFWQKLLAVEIWSHRMCFCKLIRSAVCLLFIKLRNLLYPLSKVLRRRMRKSLHFSGCC